jgi:nicotinamidase-related amidase
LLTEQYPQGLGATHADVTKHLDGASPQHFVKTCFGCTDDSRILKAVQDSGMQQIILAGMETHICVTLTARGLHRAGFDVHVCRDAVLARTTEHHESGLQLMREAGAHITNSETAIFEMMHMSGGTTFKQISNYLKAL